MPAVGEDAVEAGVDPAEGVAAGVVEVEVA